MLVIPINGLLFVLVIILVGLISYFTFRESPKRCPKCDKDTLVYYTTAECCCAFIVTHFKCESCGYEFEDVDS